MPQILDDQRVPKPRDQRRAAEDGGRSQGARGSNGLVLADGAASPHRVFLLYYFDRRFNLCDL
jgi:hypothetical protein